MEIRLDARLAQLLSRSLHKDGCLFLYSGSFPDEHSARLIELGEALDGLLEGVRNSKGRLAYVMVEAFQNIVRHRADAGGTGEGRSLFLLGCGADGQRVTAQNAVTPEQERKLRTSLERLQELDADGLKSLFLEGIQRASAPGTRGAGLGLIEMVRRSGGRVSWSFSPLPCPLRLFTLSLDLGEGTTGLALEDGPWREMMIRHGLALAYAGAWSAEVLEALLGFAEPPLPVAERLRATSAGIVPGEPALLLLQEGSASGAAGRWITGRPGTGSGADGLDLVQVAG
jgi:hypothetical protein